MASTERISWFQGQMEIGDILIPCHVLDDGTHVVAQRGVVHALTGITKGNLDRYIQTANLSGFIDLDKIAQSVVDFSIPGTQYKAVGYKATTLIDICDAYQLIALLDRSN